MNFPPPSEKQARIIWMALTGLSVALLVALVGALFWGFGRILNILSPVLWPLAVAGVIAYLLDPVVDWFQRKGMSRARAIICVFGVAFLIVAGVLGLVIPQIVRQTQDLISRIPVYAQRIDVQIHEWIENPTGFLRLILKSQPENRSGTELVTVTNESGVVTETNVPRTQINSNGVAENVTTSGSSTNTASSIADAINPTAIRSATGWLTKVAPEAGRWIFGQVSRVASWVGVLVGLALVPIYAFYLLLEKKGIATHWSNYLPVSKSKFKEELVFVIQQINNYLVAFFRGQVLVAICDAILYTIGFLIIGLPYAVLLGFAAVFLTLIPFLGAIALCVAALIIAFVQFGDWLHPFFVLVVFGIVQTLEGFVISPKIMGDRVGLHPLTIIIAVMVGTTLLGGLLGGILAIPLTAVLRVLMERYVWKRPESSRDRD